MTQETLERAAEIRNRVRSHEVVENDIDVMRAVSRAQKWLADNPQPADKNDLTWMVAFCDMAMAMFDEAFGPGTIESLFDGFRKSAALLVVAVAELTDMVNDVNKASAKAIEDLTATVPEE